LLAILLPLSLSFAEDNGLAKTPPQGWNPWNCYASAGASETIVLAAAAVMKAKLPSYEYSEFHVSSSSYWPAATTRSPSFRSPSFITTTQLISIAAGQRSTVTQ
tara:strand:- start:1223 stop:1534 length:312 start_codon:yes stop_codon:yes gene_type:complete